MRQWRVLPDERMVLYSPIGLQPFDEYSGEVPTGWVSAKLDIRQGNTWSPTSIAAFVTSGGVITYPGLGRQRDVVGQPARRYRVRLEAQFYRPFYRTGADGIEFDAFPYNDTNPPRVIVAKPQRTALVPGCDYPFEPHVPVLHGNVVDDLGKPVEDARVDWANKERVLTDARGCFSLPLRLAPTNKLIEVYAFSDRTHKFGWVTIRIDRDVTTNHTITIT